MTTEQFWEKYMTEDILSIFDITYDFFSKELPLEFIEDYDVGEVVIETRCHHETAKDFDKVLKFTELIQNKQPKLYQEFSQYFDNFLVDYYSYHKNNSKVESAFANFVKDPEKDVDKFRLAFKKLLFYQYPTILDNAIIEVFETINNSSNLIGNTAFEFAIAKYYINLEYYFNQAEKVENFKRKEFAESVLPYEFKIDINIQTALEKGLYVTNFQIESILKTFNKNRNDFTLTIQGLFHKEMKNKNFSFLLSGTIWDKMTEFWDDQTQKNNQKPDNYFQINPDKFEKYLSKISGDFFIDNQSEMIATLWGSVYVYDFLHSINLISQNTYNDFTKTSKKLKGKVIGQFTSELWNSNFIHQWTKPDSISEIEFKEEEKIFQKSLHLKSDEFSNLRIEISEELNNIGELAEYIIQGGKIYNSEPTTPLFKNLFNSLEDEIDTKIAKQKIIDQNIDYSYKKIEPIISENKVGRNDPCPCGSGKKYKKCCEN